MPDWNPESYARFRGLRLRPALDLLMQFTVPPAGDIVDLGCGDGAAAASLRTRFPKRRVIGVDASSAMLTKAHGYHQTVLADAAVWQPESPPAVIFSNAALHWLGDHTRLMPRLAGLLAPGGTLAVQMPRQFDAPSHRLLREVAATLFPDRFDVGVYVAPVHPPADYFAMLSPLGAVDLWETDYLHVLDRADQGHPVRLFTESTAMRPILQILSAGDASRLTLAYDAALRAAYPMLPDGRVLFSFRRLFIILKV
jgi:trans-aconitate 2-methyltransferase